MTGGEGPRKRGRPKGSKNRRAADLKGFIDARYGGSAALQSAAMCMVTPRELAAAGGSMTKAAVAKALELVEAVRQVQAQQDQGLRDLVRDELAIFAADVAGGALIKEAIEPFLKRVKEGAARFTLRDALEMLAKERAALLPYTDQRQPLAVDVQGKGLMPAAIIMGAERAEAVDVEKVGEFQGFTEQVSPPQSHEGEQAFELPGLLPPPAAD